MATLGPGKDARESAVSLLYKGVFGVFETIDKKASQGWARLNGEAAMCVDEYWKDREAIRNFFAARGPSFALRTVIGDRVSTDAQFRTIYGEIGQAGVLQRGEL